MKKLWKGKWISTRSIDGYEFSHEQRCNGKIVAVLIFDSKVPDAFYGRFENTPAHSRKIELTSLTGGVDAGNSVKKTAVIEIFEESGFKAKKKELISLGTVRPSKSADTVIHLFCWDAAGKTPSVPLGDNSKGEVGSYCRWVDKEDLVWSKDPLVSAMILRLTYKLEAAKISV